MRRAIAAVVMVCALVGVACGGDDSSTADPRSSTTVEGGHVAVEHIYGTTELAETPQRIVTVGYHGADVPVSLGVIPVGMERDENGADEQGFQPWLRQSLDDLGAELPDVEVRTEAWELNFEHIASLRPDLIIATRGWISEEEYELLTAIAPTVGPLVAQGNPGRWDDELRVVAEIFGKQAEAEEVIAGVEAQVAAARAAHPRLDGTTVAWGYDPIGGQIDFLASTFGGLNTLRLFGITDDPSVAEIGSPGAELWLTSVSLERLEDIEADFALVLAYDPELGALNDPVFAGWPPIAEGRYIYYADYLVDSAISNPTALNIPWMIDESGFLDLVERAVDGGAITIREDRSVRSHGEPLGA